MSKYEDVRQRIRDGDLITVRGQHLIDHITSAVTASPYTHTGVAVWLDDRLFMADLNSGRNHLTALSCVPDFDVYAPPAGLDRPTIRAAVFDWLADPINYGMLAFVAIGVRCMLARLLHLKLVLHWRRIIVCSGGSVMIFEMAAHMMTAAGLTPPKAWLDHTRMLSPGELANELTYCYSVRAEVQA